MGTGRRLLLADDSITIQKVVNLTFADEGMDVTMVSNGDLAVEKFEEIGPDIVLADIHMPGLNGYEVCEYVKRSERFRDVPVMLLVGSFEPFNEAEARRVGADDYLTKPFLSIRQLVSKVNTLLGGKSAQADSPAEEPDSALAATHGAAEDAGRASPPVGESAQRSERSSSATGDVVQDPFADPSLDDAMIEATPAGDFKMNRTISGSQRPTTPLSAADLEEAGINLNPSTIHTQDTQRLKKREQPSDIESQPVASPATRFASSAAADDALLDLGELEPPQPAGDPDDFFLDIWDDAPEDGASSHVPSAEPYREPVASSGGRFETAPAVAYHGDLTESTKPSRVSEYAQADVVEAQPLMEDELVEETDREVVTTSAESARQASANSDKTQQPADASTTTAARSGQITPDQLSPEVIDAIARRVVEQLSERVVEQIAWEVVPQLAELLIKRRLDEEKPKGK